MFFFFFFLLSESTHVTSGDRVKTFFALCVCVVREFIRWDQNRFVFDSIAWCYLLRGHWTGSRSYGFLWAIFSEDHIMQWLMGFHFYLLFRNHIWIIFLLILLMIYQRRKLDFTRWKYTIPQLWIRSSENRTLCTVIPCNHATDDYFSSFHRNVVCLQQSVRSKPCPSPCHAVCIPWLSIKTRKY